VLKEKIIIVALFILMIILVIIILPSKKEENKAQSSENTMNTDKVNNMDNIENESKEIFEAYYEKAEEKLKALSLEEKIGQIFLVRYPEKNKIEELQKYKFGGYLFFEKDFKNKSQEEIKGEIANLQANSNIPLLIAVDEEGGKIVRVSSNNKLIPEKFKSPSELYKEGGLDRIKQDTINKSNFLYDLGINLNLAPVVDIATDKTNYIYDRTLGEGTEITSEFAKTVISASKLRQSIILFKTLSRIWK